MAAACRYARAIAAATPTNNQITMGIPLLDSGRGLRAKGRIDLRRKATLQTWKDKFKFCFEIFI